eukprot:1154925-Pelagomonas_calceolata.AAC.12
MKSRDTWAASATHGALVINKLISSLLPELRVLTLTHQRSLRHVGHQTPHTASECRWRRREQVAD